MKIKTVSWITITSGELHKLRASRGGTLRCLTWPKRAPLVQRPPHQLHLLGDFGRQMMRNMDADVVAEKFDPAHSQRKEK
jgi:hypothetical protein